MASPFDKSVWQLSHDYSIQIVHDPSSCVTIELHRNQMKINSISLNDDQCATLTHRLCETADELAELLINMLKSATPVSGIRVVDDKLLEISFPIYVGSQNRKKIWSFSIDFPCFSTSDDENKPEAISLDPLDWKDARLLGHQIMDDMLDYLRDLRLRPTCRLIPPEAILALSQFDLPLKGQSLWQVYEQVRATILPYPAGNIHPRFWGFAIGSGSLIGALAELITATMNTNSAGGHQASTYVESQILSWLKLLMGFPNDDTCSGALVSGTSVATIIAMAVAKKKFHGRLMKIYYSSEAHTCLIRAAQLLGIEQENMVVIPTNDKQQIDLQALVATIDPKSCGFVVGSAGTVGTGAIDDLQGLADLCAHNPNDMWFHVDGAIGAVARCSTRLRPLFAGLERADSIAFDLHKWLFVPYECGCILVRDGAMHRSTFAQPPASYMGRTEDKVTSPEEEIVFSDYTLELSRSMKSLKVWMTLKAYGIEKLGQIMEQNVDQIQYFIELIQQHHTELEVLATGSLNIVCFRYRLDGIDLDTLNKLNTALMLIIAGRGIGFVSPYVINSDTFVMRMCIMNHRTKWADLDLFLEKVLDIGRELLKTPEFSIVKS
ncbi:hypothetical protein I4U23_021840 [Adineta vaga]|nr:hypothetical protein I4U23_021840 [Adineta vaga]